MRREMNHAETRVCREAIAIAGCCLSDYMDDNPSESLVDCIRAVISMPQHGSDGDLTDEDFDRLEQLAKDAHDAKSGMLI